ncbi:DUF2170 domain-containing protein, partial [Pseudoalteromonas sp. S4488]
MELNELSIHLASFETEGVSFESLLRAYEGVHDVLEVFVDGDDELPIYVTHTEAKLLCIS